MQSVSPSPYARVTARTRAALPGSVMWSALLVSLLTFAVASSTVTASWVPGMGVVTVIALGGAALMAALAVTPVPWAVAVAIWFALGPVVAAIASGPTFHALHAADPTGIAALGVWWGRLLDGTAIVDTAFDLYLICWLMWLTGGWLAWCVLRWRRPLLGLVPGAAAFTTNLLNFPTDQNGYVLAVLVLTLALLLWTNYTSSIANAVRARVKLTGDARWDFWESGLVAMAALIVISIMLPPLSTVDRTVDIEASAFTSWAQLLQTLSHPGSLGHGSGLGAGTTGFSLDVPLGGALTRTKNPVFTYTWTGAFTGPRYFRGVNETAPYSGEWHYPVTVAFKDQIAKDDTPALAESYQKLALATFNIRMLAPPNGNADILFYPGQLRRTDRDTVATETLFPSNLVGGPLATIDRLSSKSPPVSTGNYKVTIEYSTATEADLKAAGTAYPDWVSSYVGLPATSYRSPDVLAQVLALAQQIVKNAGARTPYDQASAIETYMRNHFRYTLTPPLPPNGEDHLAYFLFTSQAGYCEFFATAMGDMLRLLGIPTRLVNGFGPGSFDSSTQIYTVRGEDAHTWVEVYFPTYGWIPFEPTNDGTYQTISRGGSSSSSCLRDLGCDTGPGGVTPIGVVGSGNRPQSNGTNVSENAPPGTTLGFIRIPDAGTLTKIIAVLLALFLMAFAAVARYLRPRSVMKVWRRTLVLARLAGAERRIGETPLELGRRLAGSFPEASEPLRTLAGGFVLAAYAPPDMARSARATVMEAWSALRPLLVRRALARLRPRR